MKNNDRTKSQNRQRRLTRIGIAVAAAALLSGGAGTFALWSVEANAGLGTINAAPKAELKPVPAPGAGSGTGADANKAAGTWTSSKTGSVKDISAYRVAPGDTLTYTQQLDVIVEAKDMVGVLAVTGAGENQGFQAETVKVSQPVLKDASGKSAPVELTNVNSGVHTATTTFEFLPTTEGLDSSEAVYDFSGVGYSLTMAPKAP